MLQKSLWFALLWRDVYANFHSFLWGPGVHDYSHRWWKPQVDRFCTQHALRTQFPDAVVENWYKQGRALDQGEVFFCGYLSAIGQSIASLCDNIFAAIRPL